MERNFRALSSEPFDVIVIGGGIYGATAAWDASLRGLRVALVEKGDFGGGTSANSAHIAHGGLRYLQHADFKRMRESIRERSILMRIAPHLVYPQPFLVPTYGQGMKGKEIMRIALAVNDLISIDRKWMRDPARRIPDAQIISKEELLKIAPETKREGLTGGAIWYDGQMRNTERLTLSFIRSAAACGAQVANYTTVSGFLLENGRVVGVKVKDVLSGNNFEIRAHMTLNTTGPWIEQVLHFLPKVSENHRIPLSKVYSIVTRPLTKDHALAIFTKPMYEDEKSLAKKDSQLLFAIPWLGHSLVGSIHLPYAGRPDEFKVREEELSELINQVNEGYPGAHLKREDVLTVLAGLIPAAAHGSATPEKHYRILDHELSDGIGGLISVVGIKYTTARDVAEKTIDLVLKKLQKPFRVSETSFRLLYGGNIEQFNSFLSEEKARRLCSLDEQKIEHLIFNYGSAYQEVLQYVREDASLAETVSESSSVLKAEVLHAVREEMAQKLLDVILRRTEMGMAKYPGEAALRTAAQIMAEKLGWETERIEEELDQTERELAKRSGVLECTHR